MPTLIMVGYRFMVAGGFEPPYKCNTGGSCKENSCCPQDEYQPYFAFHRIEQWCEGGDLDKPYPMKLGCLYRAGIITDARVFYCPANSDPFFRYETADPQRLWEQWERKTIRSCYFYYNFLKKIGP